MAVEEPIRAVWDEIASELRARLSEHAFALWFGMAVAEGEDADGALLVAVPNDFTREWIEGHFGEIVALLAADRGLHGVRFLVDPKLAPHTGRKASAIGGGGALDRDVSTSLARSRAPGVIARLLAERGFWSLSPGGQLSLFEVDDLRGSLQVLPSALGSCGMFEAIVFTGLLSLWANGPRDEPAVATSARQLADLLGLSWYGDLGERLRRAVDLLALTGYRLEASGSAGGWTDAFTLLDRAQTVWSGAPTSPRRHIRAVFSEPVFAEITRPRMIRPVDLAALRAIGEQRDIARRLFLFLEGSPAPVQLGHGHEGIERIVDHRLAGTLGAARDLRKLRQHLVRAAGPIVEASPRYEAIDVVRRTKRGLRRGEPRYLLRVVRARLAKAP